MRIRVLDFSRPGLGDATSDYSGEHWLWQQDWIRRRFPKSNVLGAIAWWLLKNSISHKAAKIWRIENVYENPEIRLLGILAQSLCDHFFESEFFDSHA